MKISDRDVKLLYVVLSIAIIACAYFFGFRKLTAANEALDKEISELKTRHTTLRTMEANAKKYSDDTVVYNDNYDKIIEKFDTGYSQEYSILFIKELEDKLDVWLSQAGLAQTDNVYTFGQIQSTNPSSESGSSVYSSDYKGYKTVLTLTYQASYDDFKSLIDYINNYKYKCTIDSMSMSYNSESDVVSGSLVVSQYAITGKDRPFNNVNINGILSGTGNIFASEIFGGGEIADNINGDKIMSDYDYYIALQAANENSAVSGITVNPRGDLTGAKAIFSEANERQEFYLRFFEEDGVYYAQYSVGEQQFPATEFEKGSMFLPGEYLSFMVLSSQREGDDDMVAVDATIVNDTDMTLNIKIANEDKGNPRFVVKSTSGDVVIYE
ncbi:MAG: hypothetical protein HDT13_06150 [Butyrivibrio sp.]|nr:hypothetical protein [Butyrivibrio sp.]